MLTPALSRTSTLTGDVFLTMKSGDVKRGADVEVLLVARTAEFEEEWRKEVETFTVEYRAATVAVAAAGEASSARGGGER